MAWRRSTGTSSSVRALRSSSEPLRFRPKRKSSSSTSSRLPSALAISRQRRRRSRRCGWPSVSACPPPFGDEVLDEPLHGGVVELLEPRALGGARPPSGRTWPCTSPANAAAGESPCRRRSWPAAPPPRPRARDGPRSARASPVWSASASIRARSASMSPGSARMSATSASASALALAALSSSRWMRSLRACMPFFMAGTAYFQSRKATTRKAVPPQMISSGLGPQRAVGVERLLGRWRLLGEDGETGEHVHRSTPARTTSAASLAGRRSAIDRSAEGPPGGVGGDGSATAPRSGPWRPAWPPPPPRGAALRCSDSSAFTTVSRSWRSWSSCWRAASSFRFASARTWLIAAWYWASSASASARTLLGRLELLTDRARSGRPCPSSGAGTASTRMRTNSRPNVTIVQMRSLPTGRIGFGGSLADSVPAAVVVGRLLLGDHPRPRVDGTRVADDDEHVRLLRSVEIGGQIG